MAHEVYQRVTAEDDRRGKRRSRSRSKSRHRYRKGRRNGQTHMRSHHSSHGQPERAGMPPTVAIGSGPPGAQYAQSRRKSSQEESQSPQQAYQPPPSQQGYKPLQQEFEQLFNEQEQPARLSERRPSQHQPRPAAVVEEHYAQPDQRAGSETEFQQKPMPQEQVPRSQQPSRHGRSRGSHSGSRRAQEHEEERIDFGDPPVPEINAQGQSDHNNYPPEPGPEFKPRRAYVGDEFSRNAKRTESVLGTSRYKARPPSISASLLSEPDDMSIKEKNRVHGWMKGVKSKGGLSTVGEEEE